MAAKTRSLHKTLLILLLVLTPPFWLILTDEGRRVSDTALLWLLGHDEIRVDLTALDPGYRPDDIRTVYADLDWQCAGQANDFGDALCVARIGNFNGLPSQLITFYFAGDRLTAMRLAYRPAYHEQLIGHVIGKVGQPGNVARALAQGPDADNVLQWDLERGTLLMKKALSGDDEPALLWLATKRPQ
jgi:hypothetical protein